MFHYLGHYLCLLTYSTHIAISGMKGQWWRVQFNELWSKLTKPSPHLEYHHIPIGKYPVTFKSKLKITWWLAQCTFISNMLLRVLMTYWGNCRHCDKCWTQLYFQQWIDWIVTLHCQPINIIITPPNNIYHEDEIKHIEDMFKIKYSTAAIIFVAIFNFTRWRRKIHLPPYLLSTLHHRCYKINNKHTC